MRSLEVEDEHSEPTNEDTFLLRPHHIGILMSLVGGIEAGPNSKAAIEQRAKERANEIRTRYNPLAIHGYGEDVTGKTEADLETYASRLVEISISFLDSSDDRPVHMIPSEDDSFCHACIVGVHCNINDTADRVWREGNSMRSFLNRAEELGIDFSHIKIQHRPLEGLYECDNEPIIITDVGTLRKFFI